MGYADDVAGAALRISLGWNTEESDIEHCIEAWQALYRRARMNSESRAA
jgi:cysteine sulfinate desulfinase/cysteine desulfurase-like protein